MFFIYTLISYQKVHVLDLPAIGPGQGPGDNAGGDGGEAGGDGTSAGDHAGGDQGAKKPLGGFHRHGGTPIAGWFRKSHRFNG